MNPELRRTMFLGLLFFMAMGSIISLNAQPIPKACRRENLKQLVNVYLAAMESHNPSSLPLAQSSRFTENGKDLAIGKGFWQTAGKTLFKRSAIDTVQCSAHVQAVIEEAGKPIIFGVRIRLNQNKISEIESFVAREKEFRFNVKGLLDTKDQDWESILPLEQRSSRLAMIAAADDYFNMFVNTPRVRVPFASPCDRWENGTQTTIHPKGDLPDHDCSPQGDVLINHKPRRFLIDIETGVVVAYVHFTSILPDFHMFKMRNGKVELIQAVVGPNNNSMGWPDAPIIIP